MRPSASWKAGPGRSSCVGGERGSRCPTTRSQRLRVVLLDRAVEERAQRAVGRAVAAPSGALDGGVVVAGSAGSAVMLVASDSVCGTARIDELVRRIRRSRRRSPGCRLAVRSDRRLQVRPGSASVSKTNSGSVGGSVVDERRVDREVVLGRVARAAGAPVAVERLVEEDAGARAELRRRQAGDDPRILGARGQALLGGQPARSGRRRPRARRSIRTRRDHRNPSGRPPGPNPSTSNWKTSQSWRFPPGSFEPSATDFFAAPDLFFERGSDTAVGQHRTAERRDEDRVHLGVQRNRDRNGLGPARDEIDESMSVDSGGKARGADTFDARRTRTPSMPRPGRSSTCRTQTVQGAAGHLVAFRRRRERRSQLHAHVVRSDRFAANVAQRGRRVDAPVIAQAARSSRPPSRRS